MDLEENLSNKPVPFEQLRLTERMKEVRRQALSVLQSAEAHDVTAPCNYLIPLALALLEAAHLFQLFGESKIQLNLDHLFDGGQSHGPNLDTRLKYIRDMCGAAVYGINRHALESVELQYKIEVEETSTPGELAWVKLLREGTSIQESETLREMARLLDDILESILGISQNLSGIKGKAGPLFWNEIYRHAVHVRDHYDYAEDKVISSMRPSSE